MADWENAVEKAVGKTLKGRKGEPRTNQSQSCTLCLRPQDHVAGVQIMQYLGSKQHCKPNRIRASALCCLIYISLGCKQKPQVYSARLWRLPSGTLYERTLLAGLGSQPWPGQGAEGRQGKAEDAWKEPPPPICLKVWRALSWTSTGKTMNVICRQRQHSGVCGESQWGGGVGKEEREGWRKIPFGNKEKALNLQISPTEAKPTLNQPQLGAAGACE